MSTQFCDSATKHPGPCTAAPPHSITIAPRPAAACRSAAEQAEVSADLCRRFVDLTEKQNISGNQAVGLLGKSAAWFSKNVPKWRRQGAAAFLPPPREPSASVLFPDLPRWFLPAASFFYLLTNRNRCGGSVPEAIRRTISLPACPPACVARLKKKLGVAALPECPVELREAILQRQKEEKSLLPETLMKRIASSAPFIRQFRSPKDADLEYNCAPGTMMWMTHEDTGERVYIRPGQVFEMDDATINFPVCIPWTMGGCPSSEKFGVKVGRFQFIPTMDVGSRYITGLVYTARPRSSYRGEDILAGMRAVGRTWGVPEIFRLEQGVFASNLVKNAIRTMGARHWGVHSPHNKLIEIFFGVLWTKLSVHFPGADLGRIRGDTEEAPKILAACQAGHRDPRKYFPMLSEALEAFDSSIAEYHQTPIRSENSGVWTPAERWENRIRLRKLNPEHDWIFSPCVGEWTVRGGMVGGKVQIMEGVSVPFDFSSPALIRFDGARVKAYFDPFEPKCAATICLAQKWQDHPSGANIGLAAQINETTQYIRWALGWGDDDRTAGKKARSQNSIALRREVRGVVGPSVVSVPAVPFSESEERTGLGVVTKISSGEACRPEGVQDATSQECGQSRKGNSTPHDAATPPLRAGANPGRGESLTSESEPDQSRRNREAEAAAFEAARADLFM